MSDSRAVSIADRIDRPTMGSLAITRMGPGVPIFASMTDVLEFAKVMAVSGIAIRNHLRNNPGACAAVCLQAQRWEMEPFSVGNKSYAVNDQIAYEAQLIAAVINTRAPIKGRLKSRFEGEGDARRCIVWATFIDDDQPTEVSSPPISKITPKNSPLWKSDPDQQLSYYTKRLWARRECPEVILGIYDRDEIDAEIRATGAVDVTPRPRREDFADKKPPVTAVAEPFEVTTSDGEVRSFATPIDAAGFMLHQMQDAAKARAADGAEGIWDSNGLLITQLREAGEGKLADELKAAYVKLTESPAASGNSAGAATDDAATPRPEAKPATPAGTRPGDQPAASGASQQNAAPGRQAKKPAPSGDLLDEKPAKPAPSATPPNSPLKGGNWAAYLPWFRRQVESLPLAELAEFFAARSGEIEQMGIEESGAWIACEEIADRRKKAGR